MDGIQNLFKVGVMNDKRYIFVMGTGVLIGIRSRAGPQNPQVASLGAGLIQNSHYPVNWRPSGENQSCSTLSVARTLALMSIAGLGYVVGGKECLVCRHCARPMMATIVGETLHAVLADITVTDLHAAR
jgi:hypothetical protein